ncbi:Cytosolic phospholipase A2 [Clydaea vesicula]|uniref:Cytosolic phospholipase A2 n=1 Tax=Clydaea vesicula TaxID=447962 RepID=A0AAD5XUI6_9FUNG|nr:Cytosolic phospholipase A2 [Clydaea vesicula]KAJ3391148.1 Cytosolic phospholipase A2 [Lobulomyces angularis]
MQNLTITFVSAEKLEKADGHLFGKNDTFLVASLTHTNSTLTHQTKTIKNDSSPKWNEKWSLQNVRAGSTLTIKLYDKDLLGKTELGTAHYTITDKTLKDETLALPVFLKKEDKSKGTVTIKVHSVPTVLPEVSVTILAARNLLAGDNSIVEGNLNDAYVEAHLDGEKFKTKVIDNSELPVWNETFKVKAPKVMSNLVCEIYDKDKFKTSDSLGTVQVKLVDLKSDLKQTFPIILKDGKKQGELDLKVNFSAVPDLTMKVVPVSA